MDYVKMEAEYNCSKEVRLRLILKPQGTGFSSVLIGLLLAQVLHKLKKGLESENADMNRDVEKEYRDILKQVYLKFVESNTEKPCFSRKEMESKRLSDKNALKTDPRYRKLEHLIQVGLIQGGES